MEKQMNDMPETADVRGVKAYDESRKAAESLVKDPDAMERFLNNLEEKLKAVPKIGGILANIPVLVSMVRSHFSGEYPQLPIGTLIGVVAALVYFVSPIDIIPDAIPGIGYLDDAMVVAVTLSFVRADVDTYKQWREERRRIVDAEAEVK